MVLTATLVTDGNCLQWFPGFFLPVFVNGSNNKLQLKLNTYTLPSSKVPFIQSRCSIWDLLTSCYYQNVKTLPWSKLTQGCWPLNLGLFIVTESISAHSYTGRAGYSQQPSHVGALTKACRLYSPILAVMTSNACWWGSGTEAVNIVFTHLINTCQIFIKERISRSHSGIMFVIDLSLVCLIQSGDGGVVVGFLIINHVQYASLDSYSLLFAFITISPLTRSFSTQETVNMLQLL